MPFFINPINYEYPNVNSMQNHDIKTLENKVNNLEKEVANLKNKLIKLESNISNYNNYNASSYNMM